MLIISYLLLSLVLFLFCFFKRWHLFCWLSYSVFLVYFLAIIPLPGEDKVKYRAPTQVVFRFDDHRFIQLTGYGCQGRMYYVDDQKQIYYELARHSAKVLTEPFAHMPEDYIFLPLSDYSAIDVSQDGGHSFRTIHIETYENTGSYQPTYNTVENIMVMNNQFFLKDKNRDIYRSPKPYGTRSAIISAISEKSFEGSIRYMGLRWTDQPQTMPIMPADYPGWQRWQCDPSLKQPITVYNRYAPLIKLQAQLRHLLGVTEEVTHEKETD
ncbi:hypothetical protein B6D08_13200 [Gilliamella apicola]|uniref:Tli3-like domain-containing protein n=1 Tax=Gilliamella apicola TaxID=1196095 RepID=A0A242NDQ1_9GAMM|nr:hypothetical protein B5S40_09655 [Gilliamella apicola]OTP83461.1 hypothetical protein B5S44_12320 [Gilliamella apicola]OTP97874.1 hypothetical protein B6D08_13200 [Gilliamella apicola]OTQ08783.1 hypothetical protein B6C91_11210 [Gilliamella apicola]OTQ15867.1 hypothetical protein B6D11_04800 [Gilliamella apicola]